MNATSEPSILTDRPVSTPVPNFQTKVSLPPASKALVAFRDTECYFQLLNVVAFQSTLRAATVPVVTLTNSWQT